MSKKKTAEFLQLEQELQSIVDKIKESQKAVNDENMFETCKDMADPAKVVLRAKRVFKGHLNKVNCVHYGDDSRHVISGALDSKLIVWDTWTGNKVQIIPLQSSWTMTCCLSPCGSLAACGGMDNQCTIFDLVNKDGGSPKIRRELLGYEGFLSCCRFIDDGKLITGSADMKIILWDIEKATKITEFYGHSGDVMTMSLHPEGNTFVTGSVDKTAKLHKNGNVFGTGSEDKSCRLFDIRCDQQIGQYSSASSCSFTSCAVSLSTRIIMGGADDGVIYFWDTVKGQQNATLSGHENKITSLTLAGNGMAITTGSWDSNVRLWV
ncbi:Guanine nucleotide-binding protein subunit beta-2 [Halotydeus destructor]|nr:Guanine nucleotide-binding protein subunit beta-2 [Halotydeus destructor]